MIAAALLAIGLVSPVVASANDAPLVSIHVGGNQTFIRQREPLAYVVVVTDTEDGDTLAGTIDPASVAVEFQYLEGEIGNFIPAPAEAAAVVGATRGRLLVEADDCLLCHVESANGPTAVPTYAAIAEKFQGNLAVAPALAVNIQNGSQGIWGTMLMPAHAVTPEQAIAMAYYILSFAGDGSARNFLPISGSVDADLDPYLVHGPFGASMRGRFLLTASYTDRGRESEPSVTDYAALRLRYSNVLAEEWEILGGFERESHDDAAVLVPATNGSVARLANIDLSGVRTLSLASAGSARRWSGGTVELRAGAADGERVGTFVVAHSSRQIAVERSVIHIRNRSGRQDLYLVAPQADSVAIGAVCFDCGL